MLSSWLKKLSRGKRRRTKRGGAMPGTAPALTLELLELRRVFVNHAIGDTVQPFLQIFVNGAEVAIPKSIGVTGTSTFSPHTEDATGKLFISGSAAGIDGAARFVTLDDFFDVWRTTNVGDATKNNPNAFFSSTQLLGNVADANNGVFMTVNGVANTEFENYIPEDGDRIILSYGPKTGAPTLAPIANTTLLDGSPLYVSLDGFDPNGQAITYTVTSNSNPSLVTTSVPSGNPSIRMQVDGFGAMTFQLLQDKASRPAERVVTLANQNFYDNLTFHRVINNFVIQGGDPLGTGAGGSSLGNFDDQFHVDLQHNRTGLLSYAKSSDDTNNSQFFITEGTSRHLDFNHSIFGVLTEGESVRDAISNVAVDGSSRPTTPVTIDTVDVITDNQNGLLFLKAAEGASGTATITVTATDSAGNSTTRTFTVTVTPDTANGGPFLNDIPAQRTTINTAKTIQLSSQDVEGNAVTYSAVKGDSLSSTVSVNSTTGLITATPPTGFVGQMLIRASVASATGQPNDTQDKSDIQTFALTVAPLAPTGLDLPDASDTGTSVTDNRTNLTTPAITINGVTSGATVKLFKGTTLLGTATASGTSVTITSSALASGSHTLTATQTVNSVESDVSSGLTITIDADAPSFTSTPPATAKVGTALTYDAATNEEGAVGLVYTLTNAPSGVTIDGASGIVSWTPTAAQLGAQSFQVVATDSAGNSATQNVTLTVSDVDLVQFRMQITDTNGTAITSLVPNQSFLLRVLAKDLRSNPSGLFAGYLDVTYQGNLASVDGALTYGTLFPNVKSGTTTAAGLIDEAGAVSGFTAGDGSEVLLFAVPMKATASGTLTFTADPADVTPSHNVLLFSRNDPVTAGQIKFVNASITIGSSINAANDTFNVNEDSAQTTLTVLANDTLAQGATGTLTVSAVGTTSNGGTVSVASGGTGVRYQPAANFFGAETFTYTVTNGTDTATATATVTVQPVNDPPTGTADSFQVPRNSSNNVLDVLANDLFAPDATETLRVTAVSNVVGGTATVGTNGAFVNFTPTAGFTGTATFTYTLADPSNATATATATITVSGTNTSPTAANDSATVAEDSSNNTINVLTNDSTGPDTGETLTVTVVGTPSNGGTASVGSTGTNVRYTPAANFVGTETFTYTISDGNGGTATATATITVTNVNDNPTAVNDTATATEDSTNVTINVLTNDLSTPDTGETLRVTAVTQGSNGGQITVGANGANVSYKPAVNFLGNETFTYTISDGNGGTATGTVTVTVANSNDNPTAVNDTATVTEDSTGNVINVLTNDSSAPDVGETLTVSGVVSGSENGGTVTVGTGGANVVYTPPQNFVGVDKFTYTLSDGNGGTATGTVTVTVTNTNDAPFAGSDTFVVGRNSAAQTLNVLGNDSDPDVGDTRTISAVGTTSNGGTVTIAADGKSLLYAPAANYLGPDSFTYTLRDAGGLTATGSVSVTVAEFQPSSVAGTVYIDLNRDGNQQSSEPGIARVTVRLIGPQGASSTTRTMTTDARGRYEFTGLPPGDYVVEQSQPLFLQDGADQVGTQGGNAAAIGNDRLTFALAENTQAQHNNFAEYRSSSLIRFRDFLARTPREFALAALDTSGNTIWAAGWSDYSLQDVTRPSANQIQLHTVDGSLNPLVATLPADSGRLETLQNTASGELLRFNGDASAYTFLPQGAGGEGEVSSAMPTLFSTLPSELPQSLGSTSTNEVGASSASSGSSSSAGTTSGNAAGATSLAESGSSNSNSNNSTTGAASTGSNASSASGEVTRAAATDAAMTQLVQSSTTPVGTRSSLGRFSARRALTSSFASSVDRVMSGF